MSFKKITFLAIIATVALCTQVLALPEGEDVVAGQAIFDRVIPALLRIKTLTEKSIINYNSFNIAHQETVNIVQPSAASVSLNRVVGVDPTSIAGTLTSNGQVLLINSSGVMFTSSARVDVPALVASTLDISNNDFLNGNYNFFKNGESAFILNQGEIKIRNGGFVCLLSQAVENQGLIQADLGTVVLASGEKMTLALDDLNEISVVIDEAVKESVFGPDGKKFDSAIKNSGTISANGGKVLLTAKVLNDVFDYSINNSGLIEARSLVNNNGVVELVTQGAPIINTGTIAAGEVKVSAIDTGFINQGEIITDGNAELPDGGKVAVAADRILQQGRISANAFEAGTAGEVSLVSQTSTILDETSSTEAKALGIAGNGGRILINSTGGNTVVNRNAVIDVSAGTVSGNAGFIEISAFEQLGFYGVLNGRAPPGFQPATVLFDPTYIFIQSSGSSVTPPVHYGDSPTTLNIDPASLSGFTGLILLQATKDITVVNTLVIRGALELNAGRDILINALIYSYGKDVTLRAGRDIKHSANGDVMTEGGNFAGYAGQDYILNDGASIITGNGNIYIEAGRDIILGLSSGSIPARFSWKYMGGDRGYSLTEIGYYYYIDNGCAGKQIVYVPLKTAGNITSGQSASDVQIPAGAFDLGFYIDIKEYDNSVVRYHSNPTLNPDQKEHIKVGSTHLTLNWEDLDNLGFPSTNEPDFNDVILLFTPKSGTLRVGSYLSSNREVRLKAGRDIAQYSGRIYADDLVMNAGRHIGSENHPITTKVNDIWAVASNGNVYINEFDGVYLQNIQALGSTVDITTGGDTYIYNVLATGTGYHDPAIVKIQVKPGTMFINGNIQALRYGDGLASIDLDAGRIELLNSYVRAKVFGDEGEAVVDMKAWGMCREGDIISTWSQILAEVNTATPTTALINLEAADDIRLFNTFVKAEALFDGPAKIYLSANDEIELGNSYVHAKSKSGRSSYSLVDFDTVCGDIILWGSGSTVIAEAVWDGEALVDFEAGDDIILDNSDVTAAVGDYGHASVEFDANDDIDIKHHSNILAAVNAGPDSAIVDLDAHWGGIKVSDSTIKALAYYDGPAKVYLSAKYDIEVLRSFILSQSKSCKWAYALVDLDTRCGDIILCGSMVKAETLSNGEALVDFEAEDNIKLFFSFVKAYVKHDGDATVDFDAGEDIELFLSTVKAEVGDGDSTKDDALVDFEAGDDIELKYSSVEAEVGDEGEATVKFNAHGYGRCVQGDIILDHSRVTAEVGNDGNSLVEFDAEHNIDIDDSTVEALGGNCYNDWNTATVDFDAGNDIILDDSTVEAKVGDNGTAKVKFNADDDISVEHSKVLALVGDWGHAEIDFRADEDITIKCGSLLLAKAEGGLLTAVVNLNAGNDITLIGSAVTAVNLFGPAYVNMNAGDNIISFGSKVGAISLGGDATTTLTARDNIVLVNSKVGAISIGGDAMTLLKARDNIAVFNSKVGSISLGGLAGVIFEACDNITIGPRSNILALSLSRGRQSLGKSAFVLMLAGGNIYAAGPVRAIANKGLAGVGMLAIGDIYAGDVEARGGIISGILLGSLFGDITLGYIKADIVLAAALNGSIYDEGDVYAGYLGMLARYNIGTADDPIRTHVRILSAYSWDIGDIYIANEIGVTNPQLIELGLYLPLGDITIGASVAANNGIIHIVTGGDMVVNSVVAPNGGVYLETLNGSIYAGRGWCPAYYKPQEGFGEIKGSGLGFGCLSDLFLMDGWSASGGPDGFWAAIVVIAPELPPGPNVIAGGYSYFSAPKGTIGVGYPGEGEIIDLSKEPGAFDPDDFNPLWVCIQVMPYSKSALPLTVPPLAGLVLNIGGISPLIINGPNGILSVSGLIKGVVRPGTTSVNGGTAYPDDYRYPALYPAYIIDAGTGKYYPQGYVFYMDSSKNCCPPLSEPLKTSETWEQIWPPIPPRTGATANRYELLKYKLPYLEQFAGGQVNPFDFITSADLFGLIFYYHPLTKFDMSAFDSMEVGADAYQFINGALSLSGHDGLLRMFDELDSKKKDKTL